MKDAFLEGDDQTFVPVLTSQAGSTLTLANWQEAGIHTVSLQMTDLLMKPGFAFLKSVTSLASYVGWTKRLVLNASLPISANGLYELRSHYDGQRLHYTASELLALLITLQPQYLILPNGMWQGRDLSLPETIFPLIPIADLERYPKLDRPYGVYLADPLTATLIEQRNKYQELPCYIAHVLSLPAMCTLLNQPATWIESDTPANEACLGQVYCSDGVISLQEKIVSQQFEPIEKACKCPVCSQQLTRAYLHHLLEHTPLLCQRFLVQHNVHYAQTAMVSQRRLSSRIDTIL